MFVVVSWDWLTVFVSFWAAVFGAFTCIEVISHLLKLLVQRKLNRRKLLATKSTNPEGGSISHQQSSVQTDTSSQISTARKTFVDEMTDSKLTFVNMFIAAVALGACGIWGMHFIGIHSLSFFIIADDQAANVQAIINQGYFNNPSYAPLSLNVLYTLGSLVVAILSVYFGLCTAAWAFGLFRYTLTPNFVDKDNEEPKSPNAVAQSDDESPVRDTLNVSKENRFGDSLNASRDMKNAAPSPRLSETRIKGIKAPKKPNALSKLLQKMKAENDALKYLREFTFFSLSIRDRTIFILGGVLTGLGVAGMHYSGMAALRVANVKLSMNPMHLSVSIVIASVVATVALWILFFLRSRHAVFAASLVMGLAVCAMHYTATAGIIPEYIEGYNTDNSNTEISGFDTELLSAHLAFSFELGILNYVHKFLK
ncbi:hypothetical protein HDV06_000429 [Boothiomyces sp. JEL0866]|nr:hypothetical protein HDV06_000429 [Boothiomyces sp. JEL0866]